MCGIVGHVVPTGEVPNIAAVIAATRRLEHRGPDGEGIAKYDTACFGHRRLGIIDLAESNQPWLSDDKRYTLVFNGEIYNYLELRKDLERLGYRFRSNGDTEVLLNSYIHYGEGCLNKFNGMFAFAIWDDHEKKLFLARDRLGKKPLYYAPIEAGISFASEISALLTFKGIDTSLDLESVHDYFAYQFIGGSQSIYRYIRKLLPGHYLIYSMGHINIHRYWKPPTSVHTKRTLLDLEEELIMLLDDAVRLRLRSDVPLGAFLSGGLDSSVIVATMRRLGADIKSFTVGFDEASYDERESARATASYFATEHHEQVMEMRFQPIMERWLASFGEPFGDPSALPTWYLSQHARDSVTVALSGDGGDELFAGYRRYQAGQFLKRFTSLPSWIRKKLVYRFIKALPEGVGYYGESSIKKAKQFIRMASRLEESPNDLLPQTFSLYEREKLFNADVIRPYGHDHIQEYELAGFDLVSQLMLTDIQTSLAEDILTKVDRMSMAHSLEVRSPFLDYRVVEFACRLPLHYKIRSGTQKYIVQSAYRNMLPRFVRKRQKHGFAVPVSKWFCKELKPLFESVVFDKACPDFLDKNEISRLWLEHQQGYVDNGFKLWSIFIFYLWHEKNKRL
jgi:asparagine synthase (glutamine-hydrolysing)